MLIHQTYIHFELMMILACTNTLDNTILVGNKDKGLEMSVKNIMSMKDENEEVFTEAMNLFKDEYSDTDFKDVQDIFKSFGYTI